MTLSERFIQLINDPSAALWASNCNGKLEPELVRLLGAQVETDREHLTFFVPLKFGKGLLNNFADSDQLTFLLAIILTNESYQLKGSYLSLRPCTEAEVALQKDYMTKLCHTAITRQSLPGDKAFEAYYDQPTVAVRMLVREVYEQTPKAGTGERVF